ncbi:DNA mismatch repair protein Mlh1 [Maniola jurtina]|uniref:DNA mismatch repair protein Mlh1 n=1 Tax=Maniola jurtina TaxID=191418 RepID=UPI001E68BD1A|nr:DNA mismatch repair protein Mlh1 [Maniola jurtina]XP_045780422.1 DNA mismatch repair protein Mlh1 [Maniola jurtina]
MYEPGIIKKLDEEVVNRIAAGEIVQRPANALKELIENSLDARSTNIIITVKAGGLKYLQIQDNGTGIRHDNLDIVCERFTTSKLSQYEDLQAISTYGFRGEALASISHIAHLTILTKTASDKCAYKASYENGKLKGPIKPCAGNNGTQITVEDLFYNVLARKRALRSPNEEYTHIMEVVGGYAIHNSHVGFTLKKFGENTDIKTPIKSSVIDNVRIIHGNSIARELLEMEVKDPTLKMSVHGYITNVNYSHKKGAMLLFINHRLVDSPTIRKAVDSVYATYLPKNAHSYVYLSLELDPKNVDVNVHPTKHEVQFLYEEQIIDRIKTAIETKLLSCNSSRVMYTQARLPGATMVDEIVRKTTDGAKVYAKDLVRVDSDTQKIDKFFRVANKQTDRPQTNKTDLTKDYIAVIDDASDRNELDRRKETNRTTNTEANVPMDVDIFEENNEPTNKEITTPRFVFEDEDHLNDIENSVKEPNKTNNINTEPNNKNPIDLIDLESPSKEPNNKNPKDMDYLDSSLVSEPNKNNYPKHNWKSVAVENENISYIDPKESFKTRTFKYERVETKLTSVKQLRYRVENTCSMNLREILANLIFIACIDCNRSLIQHSTKLYLCETSRLTEELFYETILYDFQNLGLIKLSNPLPLEELFVLGLRAQEDEWNPELGDMRELSQQMVELLVSKRAMLLEYFSLEVTSQGELAALPLLVDGHTPFMGALPTYLVRLVTEVNWDSEKECFDTFSRQTAIFYSQPNPDTLEDIVKSEMWKQEHIIFPAIRRNFLPPTSFVSNGAILQIASLADLYKVFERC